MEAGHGRGPGTQREPAGIETLWPGLWRNWSGYHRSSRGETKMNCVKRLGPRLMSRDFDRQVAEVQTRAAVMNRFTALGIPVTVAMG